MLVAADASLFAGTWNVNLGDASTCSHIIGLSTAGVKQTKTNTIIQILFLFLFLFLFLPTEWAANRQAETPRVAY